MFSPTPQSGDLFIVVLNRKAKTTFAIGFNPAKPQLRCREYEAAFRLVDDTARRRHVDVWIKDRASFRCVAAYRH